jgi:hypothetical protein
MTAARPLRSLSRPASRPPCPQGRWALWGLVTGLVVVFVLFLGLLVYLNPLPGSNCTDWYVYCPTGPGATPLGTALAVGNGTGACAAGNASSPLDCGSSPIS